MLLGVASHNQMLGAVRPSVESAVEDPYTVEREQPSVKGPWKMGRGWGERFPHGVGRHHTEQGAEARMPRFPMTPWMH